MSGLLLFVLGMLPARRTRFDGCPHCGSRRPPIVKDADEVFLEQRGCLDCNEWWEKPQLRNP